MPRRLSLIAVWAICVCYVAVRCTEPSRQVLTWDVFGYYLYLPATVIHDDPALKDRAWLDEVMTTYEPSATLYQLVDAPDGGRVIKYSAGMAMAYAPWFFAAHVLAEPLGFPADGFSPPYQLAIAFGCSLYALLGLFLLRRVLLHFFDDRWTAALLVLITLGTNHFQLTAWNGTLLTHSFLFSLYAALVLLTIHWHHRPRWQEAVLLGLVSGAITLVRPSEGVCLLIPLLWGLGDREERARKAQWLRTHPWHVPLAAMAFFAATLPQLLYWKGVTGEWVFYSYVNPGEGFDFAAPHIGRFLAGFRKGWLVYTPLIILALAGIPMLWKRLPAAAWAIAVFVVVDIWIVSSWSCWWYAGGSFSARGMVPAYVVLVIPLGVLLQRVWSWRRARVPLIAACALIVLLNLFQTWQWATGIISHERMTWRYYLAVFGRTTVPPGAEDLLMVERSFTSEERFTDEARYNARDLFVERFDDRPDSAFRFTEQASFSPGPDVAYYDLTQKDHAWLRTTVRLWVGDTLVRPPTIVTAFHHDGAAYKYAASTWTIPPGTPPNSWITATMDYLTPEVRSWSDNVKVYVWDQYGSRSRVDDLRVQVFERADGR